MSIVYLGTDEVLGRVVAIKVLRSEFMESDVGTRFRREGRTAAQLSHPNIVRVYDAGEGDLEGETVSYIIMEHVSGGDLRDLIYERGTLTGEEISTLSGVAAGLAHAHERGIVHRDVKPHNILLGENKQPKLTDFGIARALDATRATRTGTYMGTARYSSPEQLQGKEVTPKSDIYSLGAMLYEAATGEPPFSGTPIEVASQHVSKPPTPPGELALLDKELEALILACLAKNPEDRPDANLAKSKLEEIGPGNSLVQGYAAGSATRATATTTAGDTATQGTAPVRGLESERQGSHRPLLIIALAAIVALLVGIGAFALGGSEDRLAGGPAGTTQEPGVQATGEPTTGEATTVQPAAQQPTTGQTVPQTAPVRETQPAPDGNSSEQAAEQAVQDTYELAAAGEYERSYEFLSPAFRQTMFPTQADWTGTMAPLESIRFVEGPDAQVTGNAARVTGVTIAERTDRTERNTVTWTLIREDGQWKLNDLEIDTDVIST